MTLTELLENVYDELIRYIPDEVYKYIPKSLITRSLLVGAVTGTLGYLLFRKRYRLPPGPFALPIIGSPQFLSSSKENLGRVFHKISKKYGPVFTLYLGPYPAIVLNRIDVINEAILKKATHYSDRIARYSVQKPSYNGQDIAFGRFGTAWKLRRKIASRGIRLFMISGAIDNKIEEAVSETIRAMMKETEPFDPMPFLYFTTVNILAGMCFGTSYKYKDNDFEFIMGRLETITESMSGGILIEDIFPPMRLFPSKKLLDFQNNFDELFQYIDKHMKDHRRNFQPDNISDLTDNLLLAQKEVEAEGKDNMAEFNDLHITLTLFDVFLAGNDTSRQTLYWAVLLIAAHPDIQTKIQQEVDSVCGRERYPCMADRENLSYTDAVLHEVMRLGTVAPLGVPRNTSCDTTIAGYDVPEGTTVFINQWAIMNDPDNWQDVDKFKPERFLDEDGKMAPKPENWLPFGAGRRVCLGEPLAKSELHLIIASLCQRVHISLEPGVPVNIKAKDAQIVNLPNPYKITIKERI
ncbi:steroid 17-alpha-hydroxylase/17,20 lyase isoform X1 [Patella vulgata]|uniref:steroid 17-alpha-hydroxylase/17,20 lyase isoform X1 n=2 Tax=Patella vulgata TaxID=6465 RepID=UPI0024A82A59|nr:steroid 17-alpha-hydroxylase/17,20 lyase isoform X1 [Patella vulgata]XP_055958530.1 steroid 17-alpha-hydroxylase/17,20 lyase isoform X1 [Patella vulgata]